MGRILRDIIVAVAGGFIVSLIVAFTTNLSRLELAGVFCLGLIACGLMFGAVALPGIIKKKYRRWVDDLTNKISGEVTARTVSELLLRDDDTATDTNFNRINAGVPGKAVIYAEDPVTLRELLIAGRMVQAKTLQYEVRSTEIHGDLAMEISQWEGRAGAALLSRSELLREFRSAPDYLNFGISAGDAYRRMDIQLSVLEEAIQQVEAKSIERE
jgi:hypothetical protein